MKSHRWSALAVGAALAAGGAHALPVDARVSTTRGEASRLSAFRGKPVVVFYEDKDSAELNKGFKARLFERARQQGLLDAAHVFAVANLKAFDFFPARQFAQAAVKKEEVKVGIPIFIDWEGELSSAPLSLPSKTSSVLLVDSGGNEVFRASGRLNDAEQHRFFELLGGLVGKKLAARR